MTNWSRRRLLALGIPLIVGAVGLSGCTGPSEEERVWASACEAELEGLSGVSHADLTIRRLSDGTYVTAVVDGLPDRAHDQVRQTVASVDAWFSAVQVPGSLAGSVVKAEVRQWYGTDDLQVALGRPAGSRRLGALLDPAFSELDRGAVSVWASTGSPTDDDLVLRARFDGFDPALLLRPVPDGLAMVTRGMMPIAGSCQVGATIEAGVELENVALAEVVEPLSTLADSLDVDLFRARRDWRIDASEPVRSEALVEAMATALTVMAGPAHPDQRVTVWVPWRTTFTVKAGRIGVESLPYDNATPSRRDVEPMVAEVVRRANR